MSSSPFGGEPFGSGPFEPAFEPGSFEPSPFGASPFEHEPDDTAIGPFEAAALGRVPQPAPVEREVPLASLFEPQRPAAQAADRSPEPAFPVGVAAEQPATPAPLFSPYSTYAPASAAGAPAWTSAPALADDPAAVDPVDALVQAETAALFGTGVPAPRPAPDTSLRPRTDRGARPERPSPLRLALRPPRRTPAVPRPGAAAGPLGATGLRRSGSSPRPLVLVLAGGAALVAGALVASTLLLSTGDDGEATSALVLPTGAATDSTAPGTGTTDPATDLTTDPATDPATGPFAPSGRDPFLALVAPAGAPTGDATASDPAATGAPSTGTGGTTDTGAGGVVPVPQTTVTVTAPPSSSGQAGGLTTAQTCEAVTGPMTAVEQVLASSASGATGALEAGTALRTAVASLAGARDATLDPVLASRLDVAASSADALRTQLLGGTSATADQVATQTARDDDVRAACA